MKTQDSEWAFYISPTEASLLHPLYEGRFLCLICFRYYVLSKAIQRKKRDLVVNKENFFFIYSYIVAQQFFMSRKMLGNLFIIT